MEFGSQNDLDLTEIGWGPTSGQDIYTALVSTITGQHVHDVMINGRWVCRDDTFLTIDYVASSSALNEAYLELQRCVSK